MKSIFICLLQPGCLWASRDQYRWLDSPEGLDPEIGLLLKQGLKIGYLPESYVNGEYYLSNSHDFTLILY